MGRRIPVADDAVAQVALTTLLNEIGGSAATESLADSGEPDGTQVAIYLVGAASKVRFQPSTRQLVLTFDLGMGDQPDSYGPGNPPPEDA